MPDQIFENPEDAMFGLLAGITTVMEILVMRELVTEPQLRGLLSNVQSQFIEKKQSDSAAVIGLMLQTFGEQREAVRTFLRAPPEGTA